MTGRLHKLPQSIVITGGADGIGAAIASRFSENGYAVHVCDNRAGPLMEMLGRHRNMRGTVADVGDPDDVKRLFGEAIDWMGSIGVLVNNVGIAGPRVALEDIAYPEWIETFRVNVGGALTCMQHAIASMKQCGGGAIINISTASTRTRLPMRTAYIASKFALEGLTLNGARELGRYAIRCNALLPGIMNNARMDAIIAARAEREGKEAHEIEQEFLRYVALGERTEPEEVADAVLFLASPAGARITGELISVSGYMGWDE
jgi:NAD(P)-dependent dehydrogenase (short-subunit alcohol dehydrogenase family)